MPSATRLLVTPRGATTFDAAMFYALAGFDPDNYYETLPGGGEVGDAGGFGGLYLLYVSSLVAASQYVSSNLKATTPYAGYWTWLSATHGLMSSIATGSATSVTGPARVLASTDVGKLVAYGFVYDAAAARLRAYAERRELSTAIGASAYVPATLPERIGSRADGSFPLTGVHPLSWLRFRGVPTLANLVTAFDTIRTTGEMPTTISGVTVTHRGSVKAALAASAASVSPQQVAPSVLADLVTGAAADAFTRQGPGATVVKIDPATPKLWSYETTPVVHSVTGFTDAIYYRSTVGDIAGASGKSIAVALRIDSQAVTSKNRDPFNYGENIVSGGRIAMRITGTNTVATFYWHDGTSFKTSATIAIPATDVGKTLLMVSVWDAAGQKLRTYSKRVELGAGVTMTAFAPGAAGQVRIGNNINASVGGYGADNVAFIGAAIADVTWTTGEVESLYDALAANETLTLLPGRMSHLWTVAHSRAAAGGVAPTTLLDQVGTMNLPLSTGTVTDTPSYNRTFPW